MIANYHTHTPRCNHAEGSEREYVEQAVAGGFRVLGFSDHTPYFFDGDYRSRIRMRPEELEDYLAVLQDLREEYRDRIRLHIGLEAEYYPKLFPRLTDFLKQYPIEYLLLGQHALENEQDGAWTGRPTEDEAVLDRYVCQTLEGLETGCFLYFAHPDILNFVGDPKVYDRHYRRLCRRARELEVPLEYNLLGFSEGKQYPNPAFWRIAAQEGCRVILGSDAHWPEGVCIPETEERGLEILRSCGVTEVLRELPIPPHFTRGMK